MWLERTFIDRSPKWRSWTKAASYVNSALNSSETDFLRFAASLSMDDEVVIEATGNSTAVERLLRPYVKRVIVANSRLVKAIAWARVKSDKVDAAFSETPCRWPAAGGLGGGR